MYSEGNAANDVAAASTHKGTGFNERRDEIIDAARNLYEEKGMSHIHPRHHRESRGDQIAVLPLLPQQGGGDVSGSRHLHGRLSRSGALLG